MKKVAIVGAEPLTRNNAPFEDPEYSIWTISNWAHADWMKRCDAVIEIHKPELYQEHPLDPVYWDWLKQTDITAYTQDGKDGTEKYPLEEILKMLDGIHIKSEAPRPLNSSISYAIALAVYQEFDVIDIYGVEMANSSEYHSQQPIFSFWVGFAAGRGIELNINCTSGLFVQPLYGYEDLMIDEKLRSYIDGLNEQKADIQRQANMLEGALQLAKQLLDDPR